ncbi:MAG: hypothetical protein M3342_09975 [Bacteroidota bacterium]|nr:hypothetical protein [Bacteroidota bacterium]
MKPLFIALTMLATIFTKTSFANEDKVTPAVLQSFHNTFHTTNVEWTVSKNLYKAQFSMNGSVVTAFYDSEGTLIATTRNITLMQIPVTLQTALKRDYKNMWVTDLLEVANEDGTEYYITVENADSKIILKAMGNFKWGVYQKIRKS